MIWIHIINRKEKLLFDYHAKVVPRIGEDVYIPKTGLLYRVIKVQHVIEKGYVTAKDELSFVHCQVDKL